MTASSNAPTIPSEIWIQILHHHANDGNLSHLWTQCRWVSQQFKSEVEYIIVKEYLPTVTIDFILKPTTKSDSPTFNGSGTSWFDTEYTGLSQDCKTALFSNVDKEAKCTQAEAKITGQSIIRFDGFLAAMLYVTRFTSWKEGEMVLKIDWEKLMDDLFGVNTSHRKDIVSRVGQSSKAPSPRQTSRISLLIRNTPLTLWGMGPELCRPKPLMQLSRQQGEESP